MTSRYPLAVWRPVRNTSGTMTQPTRGFIPHVQQGNGSLYARFNDASTLVSSHLWLSKAGLWEQYVDLADKAWAQAAGNPYWIAIECEGFDTEDYTPVQVEQLASFYAWGISEFGWKAAVTDSIAGYGIGTHVMGGAAWGGHSCPGKVRANRRTSVVRRAIQIEGAARYARQPTVAIGSTGPAVVTLQNALNIIFGHEAATGDPNRLTPDGVFGTRTEARVGSLQGTNFAWCGPITVDGVVGPLSWRKVGTVLTGMNRTA